MNNLKSKNLIKHVGLGLSNWALIFTYSLCCAAALGKGLISVLASSVFCALFSLTLKNKILCPDALLLVPVIYVFSSDCPVSGIFSILFGSLIFLLFTKIFSKATLPKPFYRISKIILALCITVLLTNVYFGIGSEGSTPFEMLSSYVSLGFHPHFNGLLTGTITLFVMITYPFKFKKLNKFLPAEFISLAIPFTINLILNPVKEYTIINESVFFNELKFTDIFNNIAMIDFNKNFFVDVIIGGIIFSITFFILFSRKNENEKFTLSTSQCIAAFSSIPVGIKEPRNVTILSSIVCVILSFLVCTCFPSLLSRIPLHSVGALLIVSAWQSAVKKEGGTSNNG